MENELNPYGPIKVLILSDRLIDNAKELADFLDSAGIQVIALVSNKEQALKYCNQKIDFLIIAGYLKMQQGYQVIAEYKKRNISFIAVHWAILDSLITYYCKMYDIPLQFERTLPISEFVAFLKYHYSLEKSSRIKEEKKKGYDYAREHKKKHQRKILELIRKTIQLHIIH